MIEPDFKLMSCDIYTENCDACRAGGFSGEMKEERGQRGTSTRFPDPSE